VTAAARVALLDLGIGNLRSVERALVSAAGTAGVAIEVVVTSDATIVRGADRLVMPGQGAFRDGSRALAGALGDAVRESIAAGKPYLGICLGLQLLFPTSEEAPGERGLDVLPGTNRRLSPGEGAHRVKIPHMGWNQIELHDAAPHSLRAAHAASPWFYFVHSFHAVPDDARTIAATATHGDNVVTAAVAWKNVLAAQFHPEKSQHEGLELLSGWLGDAR
jgi:glutamine amidotransferase